jgi:hypothetical protein
MQKYKLNTYGDNCTESLISEVWESTVNYSIEYSSLGLIIISLALLKITNTESNERNLINLILILLNNKE